MFYHVNITILALKFYSPVTFYICYPPFHNSICNKKDIFPVLHEKKTPNFPPLSSITPLALSARDKCLKKTLSRLLLALLQVMEPSEYFYLLLSHAPPHHDSLVLLRWFSFLNSRLLLEVSFLVYFSISRIFI